MRVVLDGSREPFITESDVDNLRDDAHDSDMRLEEFNPYHDQRGRFASKRGPAIGIESALGGVTGPDMGQADPQVLDADGKPWLNSTGEHSPGWGPRGPLNERGEEVLSAKGMDGKYYQYAVPRGYHDVVNPGWNSKGFNDAGHGVAYTKPSKGIQHFEVRTGEHSFQPPTRVVRLRSEGKSIHTVTDETGRRVGTVSDMGKGKWSARAANDTGNSGQGVLAMRYDSKPLAVLGLVQEATRTGLLTEAHFEEYNPYHDARGRFASKNARGATLDSRSLATKVASGADEGGGSFDLAGGSPESGIMVSYAKKDGHGKVLEATTKAQRDAAIRDWVKEQRSFVRSNKDNHYGVWVDGGKTYLDVSQRFPKEQRAAAIKAGKSQNQIAVFDLDTFTEIGTGGTGD
jgi:hypothetical protein